VINIIKKGRNGEYERKRKQINRYGLEKGKKKV
jgi:hypothetical protein